MKQKLQMRKLQFDLVETKREKKNTFESMFIFFPPTYAIGTALTSHTTTIILIVLVIHCKRNSVSVTLYLSY